MGILKILAIQKFIDSALGRAGDVWVIGDLFIASDGMSYAKLAAEVDPSLSKTLSIAALIDRRRFLPA
jgi:hypothetical protein